MFLYNRAETVRLLKKVKISPLRRLLHAAVQPLPARTRFTSFGFPTPPTDAQKATFADSKQIHTLADAFSCHDGACLTSEGTIIPKGVADLDYLHQRLVKRQRLFPRIYRSEQPVLTLITLGQSNYFHWLFEVLPRMCDIPHFATDPFLIHVDTGRPFHLASLSRLGIDSARIISSQKYPIVQSKSLIIPPVIRFDEEWIPAWLQQRFPPKTDSQIANRRLFITRKQATSRKIQNEDELLSALRPLGFEPVLLENQSFDEQIALFQSAELIMGPHGAGWTNLIFARAKCHAIEIMSSTHENNLYRNLAHALKMPYTRILAPPTHPADPINSDVTVDVSSLVSTVKGILSEGG